MSISHSYSSTTVKSLYAHSGNQCAFPGCNQILMDSETASTSAICHIYGLNPDSARYTPNLAPAVLNSEANLILLCPTHHAEIDAKGNQGKYPPEVLFDMKQKHEEDVRNRMGNMISVNQTAYSFDIDKVKRRLKSKYDIGLKKKQIQKIANEFSRMNQDIRTVMRVILDIYDNNPGKDINMRDVYIRLLASDEFLASVLEDLERNDYITEYEYPDGALNSWIDDGEGNAVNVGKNYLFKLDNGRWGLTASGFALYEIYQDQSYL